MEPHTRTPIPTQAPALPPPHPPTRGRGSGGYPSYPPLQGMGSGVWDTQGGIRHPTGPIPAPVLVALGISNAITHTFAAALQVVVTAGMGEALTSPSPATPSGRVAALLLLHICFVCG